MEPTSDDGSESTSDSWELRALREVKLASGCTHPIRLRGEAVNLGTGEIRTSGLRIACKDRRAVVCPPCSYLYKADAWILVAAGLNGGKGVPESIGEHPRLFVTLTAPSFGVVHRRTDTGHCHPRRPVPCRHGVILACRRQHPEDDSDLGSPLCAECFDYAGAVLWNAQVARLWNRTVQEIKREVARQLDLDRQSFDDHLVLSYMKVAEFQRRGLVHLHAVLRLDGAGQPWSAPPSTASAEDLSAAVTRVITSVRWKGVNETECRWGEQFDVSVLPDKSADQLRLASYVAKYATKTTDGSIAFARRFETRRSIENSRAQDHHVKLALAAWDLSHEPPFARLRLDAHAHAFGFTGQLITKSRNYSSTFRELREVRSNFMSKSNETDPIVGTYHYDGRGYDDPRAATLAAVIHSFHVECRREARARRVAEAVKP